MPRTVQSPIPEFPGSITVPDHLYLDQVLLWEECVENASALRKSGSRSLTKLDACYLPAIDACIQAREIAGWGEQFPMTPRVASARLISWVLGEIRALYEGETDIPNASRPEPTDMPKTPATSPDPVN